mmetsp:Transcript_24726/g.68840  ORF Transcript_24726/g.68840 Transcript_24726/m.68840 type:complete len:264 (-) Transcript_24726:431-1222(-)
MQCSKRASSSYWECHVRSSGDHCVALHFTPFRSVPLQIRSAVALLGAVPNRQHLLLREYSPVPGHTDQRIHLRGGPKMDPTSCSAGVKAGSSMISLPYPSPPKYESAGGSRMLFSDMYMSTSKYSAGFSNAKYGPAPSCRFSNATMRKAEVISAPAMRSETLGDTSRNGVISRGVLSLALSLTSFFSSSACLLPSSVLMRLFSPSPSLPPASSSFFLASRHVEMELCPLLWMHAYECNCVLCVAAAAEDAAEDEGSCDRKGVL